MILACNGFGGNREMVAEYMSEINKAVWFGHDGNRGEAVVWGLALGAETRHLGAYQGHGNVAHPHGILVTWATITEGGVQGPLKTALDDLTSKWQFIRNSYINYNDNNVAFVIDRYSKGILRGLETTIGLLRENA